MVGGRGLYLPGIKNDKANLKAGPEAWRFKNIYDTGDGFQNRGAPRCFLERNWVLYGDRYELLSGEESRKKKGLAFLSKRIKIERQGPIFRKELS